MGYTAKKFFLFFGPLDVTCSGSGITTTTLNNINPNTNDTVITNISIEPLTGDTIENPIWISGDSYSNTNNTESYWDNYEIDSSDWWPQLQDSPDVVYAFTLTSYKTINIALSGASFETQVGLFLEGNNPQTMGGIAYGTGSLIDLPLGPGTYYIVVDGKITEQGIIDGIIDGDTGAMGTYNLSFEASSYIEPTVNEGFENETPLGWIITDANTDDFTWEGYFGANPFGSPYSGEGGMRVMSWYSDVMPVDMDEWLISPVLKPTTGNTLVKFHYKAVSPWWEEQFQVRLSTTGTNIEDFDVVLQDISLNNIEDWQLFEEDLSDYMDQEVYIAVVYNSIPDLAFGLDVDAFELPYLVYNANLALISFDVNYTPIMGEDNQYTVKVKNLGLPTSNYIVKLKDIEGNVLASSNGIEIPYNSEQFININWSPTETGETEVYAFVEIIGDEVPENNESQLYKVHPQEEGLIVNNVGNESNTTYGDGYAIPMTNNSAVSLSESLYLEEELPGTGEIKTMVLRYTTDINVDEFPLIVRMGVTQKTHLTGTQGSSFIPANELTTVFDGTVNLNIIDNKLVIPLDSSFDYSEGNLVVMMESSPGQPLSDNTYFFNKCFSKSLSKISSY